MSDNLYRVGPRKARELILDCLQADVSVMVEGPPGGGKSSVIKSIADEAFLDMTDHRVSTSVPEDFTGLPRFDENGYARFSPFADLFPLSDRPIPDGKKGFMLFLDEFNSGKEDVMAAAYKLILDRKIGQHSLHEACAIVAAGNRMEDRAIVNEVGTAMQSRMAWIEMQVIFEEWLYDVALKYDYDYRIIAYLSQFKDKLMDFRPDHTDKTFCCPRTWEFMNRLVKGKTFSEIPDPNNAQNVIWEMDGKAALYAGTITSGVAAEFIRYTRIGKAMPTLEDILADPTGIAIPQDASLMWMIISNIMSQVTPENYMSLGMYANRFEMSFKILFFRSVLVRNKNLRHHPVTMQAQIELSKYLNGA